MITKEQIQLRKKEILDEIERLESEKKNAISIVNKIIKVQSELKGAYNELNKLEKDA